MKIRTSLRAGGSGCSPEAQNYMQKALAMESKVQSCLASGTTYPAYTGATYPTYPTYPTNTTYPTYAGATYPDMSGSCG